MPSPRDFVVGPWRAVTVLGVTEILSWGAIFYPPVLTVPLIAADHGWSKAFTMGGFSVGLLVGGLVSRYVGGAIDRYGGHVVMPCGSLIGALGLAGLVVAHSRGRLFRGVDGAGRRHGGLALRSRLRHARPDLRRRRARADHDADAGRRLCLDRGLAGDAIPHRYRSAGAAPIWSMPRCSPSSPRRCTPSRCRASARKSRRLLPPGPSKQRRPPCIRRTGSSFALVATAFAAYAFVPSALSAHLLAIFKRFGLEPDTVVADRHAVRPGAGLGAHRRAQLSRAISIRCGSRVSRSAFWSRPSR